MPVIALTVVASLCLVFTFVVFFLSQHTRSRVSSAERDSLLPFADEQRREAARTADRTTGTDHGPLTTD